MASEEPNRVAIGLLLKKIGGLWTICRDIAYTNDVLSGADETLMQLKYSKFTKYVESSGLSNVWELKPLLNVIIP